MRKQNRLTWGGLIRILLRRPSTSYDKEHIKIILRDNRKIYVNIKYDAYGRPYFIEVPDHISQREEKIYGHYYQR